ncbi:MAG: type II toxin-antitoxin system RelE/ParE family toxin [Desulfovibrio sp.]|jgi:putative addiction module killer protein|nr:type II toxin-antitoxin system RelE/ParE family toxin [Desulfovibrio sp.]
MEERYHIRHYLTEDGKDIFAIWLRKLKDARARMYIVRQLDRAALGNFGDHKSCGSQGLWELRIDYGPGYRVYYCLDGGAMIILLCGGDKSTQDADIAKAKAYKINYDGSKRHD